MGRRNLGFVRQTAHKWVNTADTYVVDDDIEHAKVLEAAVVGWLDEDSLTKPAAFVLLNDSRCEAQERGDSLQARISAHRPCAASAKAMT